MNYGLSIIVLLVILVTTACADESQWFLMSREGGCITLERLAKRENLPKTPATPYEFAQMMRDRGYHVTVGLPEGFPAAFSGRFVQVTVREGMMPVFVRKETCEQIEK